MHILWFAITPSMYEDNLIGYNGYNGGGWVASLERLIRSVPDIELSIAFDHKDTCFKKKRDGVVYYPTLSKYFFFDKFDRLYNYGLEEQKIISQCQKIINDFKTNLEFYKKLNIKDILKQLIYNHNFAKRAEREKRILTICQNNMERTRKNKI